MAKGDLEPRGYIRGNRPQIPGGEAVYLEEELARVEQTLRDVLRAVPQVAFQAPTEPENGMIRYAKAPWDPMGTGDGFVGYKNGVWVAL